MRFAFRDDLGGWLWQSSRWNLLVWAALAHFTFERGGMGIWWLVGLSVIVVLVAILIFRLHAFLTLLLASWLIALLTPTASLQSYAEAAFAKGSLSQSQADGFPDTSAVNRVVEAFGETAGKIGVLIALASVIGSLLMKSGAASVIVDAVLRLTGPKRAPEALAASSFVLGIPVFFDTVFYLMIPLAQSLRRRVGKDYVLFILAILAGGSIAHSLIPPTPGPLQVADIIGVDIGTMLVAGLCIGSVTSVFSLLAARVINRFVTLDLPGHLDAPEDLGAAPGETLVRPPLMLSLLPIIVPVLLISIGSVLLSLGSGDNGPSPFSSLLLVIADKNIAIAIGCCLAFLLVRYIDVKERQTIVGNSIAAAGGIILITAAGGAFGAVLRQAGIAAAVGDLAESVPGLWLLPLAFGLTAAIRTLQGSATVAMITSAGVLQGLAQTGNLPFHPVYLAMAIGAGSKPVSWMTDSAFWIITRMTGMTESQGLKTISPMSAAMGVAALIVTMIFAYVYPAIEN